MQLPGSGFPKKAFVAAAATVGLAGCAVVPGPYGRLIVEPVIPAPVYVEPAPVYPVYPTYPVYGPPVIVVPGHGGYHGGSHHHDGWRR